MDREALRMRVYRLCETALQEGDPCGWFEPLYRESQGSTDRVPWADGAPNSHFVVGMEHPAIPRSGRALVLGCGFGDDAEELSARGFEVTAFDVSSSAIEWCGRKHPDSAVSYEVRNLFQLPTDYRGAFDLVLEVYTLQAIPLPDRSAGFRPVAECVAPGGVLLAIMRGRDDGRDFDGPGPPWAISREECSAFEEDGLVLVSWEDYLEPEEPFSRRFRSIFRRPDPSDVLAGGQPDQPSST